jgi:replicative DNA helicase
MEVDNFSTLSGQMKMDKGMQRKFIEFKALLQESPLLITEGIGKNWEDVTQLIEAIGDKPKVVIVDYIQNIAFRTGDTREVINDYIRRFRNMAIKHSFAGVLCSQINRGAEQQKNNEPTLAQLKETGFLEESADMVLLLYWKAFYGQGYKDDTTEFVINVAKNRNGRTGDHTLLYTPKYYRFSEGRSEPMAMAIPRGKFEKED